VRSYGLTGKSWFDPGSNAIWIARSRSDGGGCKQRGSGVPATGIPPVSGGARGTPASWPDLRLGGTIRDGVFTGV
jgi:hypothetical protein